jgi:iron complex outermembrane receptor protein
MRNPNGAMLLRFHNWSFVAAALLGGGLAQNAVAQSTGTEAAEEGLTEVVVTATRIRSIGIVGDQNAPKSRVSLAGEYLDKQLSGQSVFQALNQVPGVNFTNNDPYGTSGGNLRIRGFDGSRVSVTFDGIPLNDSGNYALFTNQMPDSELIDRVDVNLGTTDVDSPTASATGGTVAFRTRKPSEEFGGQAVLSGGEDNYRRAFLRVDSGAFGPWGTKAYVAASYQNYDKFKGPGELEKKQFNAVVRQDFENENFVSLALHYNVNRNAFYRNSTEANFEGYGRDFDNLPTCTQDAPTAGVADNDNFLPTGGPPPVAPVPQHNDNPAYTGSCTNFYGVRINPSDTGNIRAQSLFHLGEKLILTFDPSWQYTLANGGGSVPIAETPSAASNDIRPLGSAAVTGFDLNGDGDALDTVRFFSPNNTNTKRWGATTSLIWTINDDQRVRLAYTWDRARHRQTAQYDYIIDNEVENVFAGRKGQRVYAADGDIIRGRDRFSIAELSQLAAEWRGQFMEDKFTATVGLRAPTFKRELNQYCYTPDRGSGNSSTSFGNTGGTLCTSRSPFATLPSGNVTFIAGAGATQYIAPYTEDVEFDDILPNLGLTFRPSDAQSIYLSYAEGLSAPRTDNLYSVKRLDDNSIGRPTPESETTKAYDLGWRLNLAKTIASVAVYRIDYTNRIVASFDPDLGFTIDRNVGDVKIQGFDAQLGRRLGESVDLSVNASFNESEILADLITGVATQPQPIKGKTLVETPKWTFGARADVAITDNLHAGLQGKKVGKRYTSDVNDTSVDGYTVFDLDVRYDFGVPGFESAQVQLNVTNLTDEEYYGAISSTVSGLQGVTLLGRNGQTTGVTGSAPFLGIGAPRTVVASIKFNF